VGRHVDRLPFLGIILDDQPALPPAATVVAMPKNSMRPSI
jgi:hypothetical protein